MEASKGFAPLLSCLRDRCSPHWTMKPMVLTPWFEQGTSVYKTEDDTISLREHGGTIRSRTWTLELRGFLFYPLNYSSMVLMLGVEPRSGTYQDSCSPWTTLAMVSLLGFAPSRFGLQPKMLLLHHRDNGAPIGIQTRTIGLKDQRAIWLHYKSIWSLLAELHNYRMGYGHRSYCWTKQGNGGSSRTCIETSTL